VLLVRLLRSLHAFGVILASYLLHFGLARLFRRRRDDGEGVSPPWLVERRRRVDEKNARRLLRAMLRLRGVFIKLGQVLSIMGGFLPRAYTRELEQLQDQVPPHPFADLVRALHESFGKAPSQLYASIDEEPIAAASLGQVHAAVLRDGRKVAVKFLYPNIRAVIAVDMRVLRVAIRVYGWFVPMAKIERVHEQLLDMLRRETDYLHEAECMRRLRESFEGDPGLAFPEPVAELTSRDVLTMTFMPGFKITKSAVMVAAGVPAKEVATRLVQAFYKMLLVDRFFHADPHPGNFLIEPLDEGGFRLVVLDFGAVCSVRAELVDGMIEILQGFFGQDDAAVLRGFRRMGFVAQGGNEELLERTVKLYFGKLLGLRDRRPEALLKTRPEELGALVDPGVEREELRELMRAFEYPEDWFYVERACVLMFWLAAQIDPTLDTLTVGMPYVMPLLAARMASTNGA
jgi:predicted unusual protein kinase regulating ubiquinone biosynthesis (AarF/ABC1/UbiB family)